MKKLLTALTVLAAAVTLKAESHNYAALAVFAPGQLPTAVTTITGVRANVIYGECQAISGFDFGIVGCVRERANGFQFNAYSSVGTDAKCGLWNSVSGRAKGFQLGLVNLVEVDFSGFECGLWNSVSGRAKGFQLGLVNHANRFEGLQIGIWNTIDTGVSHSSLPLVNWCW